MRLAQRQVRPLLASDPRVLLEMLSSADAAKSQRAMGAMMQMKKMDIAALKKAYDG